MSANQVNVITKQKIMIEVCDKTWRNKFRGRITTKIISEDKCKVLKGKRIDIVTDRLLSIYRYTVSW